MIIDILVATGEEIMSGYSIIFLLLSTIVVHALSWEKSGKKQTLKVLIRLVDCPKSCVINNSKNIVLYEIQYIGYSNVHFVVIIVPRN